MKRLNKSKSNCKLMLLLCLNNQVKNKQKRIKQWSYKDNNQVVIVHKVWVSNNRK